MIDDDCGNDDDSGCGCGGGGGGVRDGEWEEVRRNLTSKTPSSSCEPSGLGTKIGSPRYRPSL